MPIASSRQHNAAAPCAILRYYANLARAHGHRGDQDRGLLHRPDRDPPRAGRRGRRDRQLELPHHAGVQPARSCPRGRAARSCSSPPRPPSLSAYILAEAFEAADFPPGVFNLVTGTHQTAGALARHPGVDTVAFSGPTKQGRWIASICGAELKPAQPGARRPVRRDRARRRRPRARRVDASAPIFGNSGQTCFAMSRVLVPEQRYDEPGRRADRAGGVGACRRPAERGHHDGPARLARRQRRRGGPGPPGRQRGRAGGVGRQAPGLAGPRLLLRADRARRRDAADADRPRGDLRPGRHRDRYKDEAEAVRFANDGFGLAATVWTGDPQRGLDIARRTRVGTFGINLYEPDIGSPVGRPRRQRPAAARTAPRAWTPT